MGAKEPRSQGQTTPEDSSPVSKSRSFRISRHARHLIKFSLFSYVFFSIASISAAQISLALGFFGWVGYLIFTPSTEKPRILLTPISRAYLIFLAAGLLSVIFAEEKLAALDSLQSFWIFFAFLFSANWIKNEKELKIFLGILIGTAGIISLLGLIQYLSGLTIFGYELIAHAKQVIGTHHSSMTLAGLLMITSLTAIPVFFPRKSIPRGWLGIIPLALTLPALLFSLQRGAWLGFAAGIIFIGLLKGRKVLVPIVISLALSVGIIYKLDPTLRQRLAGIITIEKGPISSSGSRILLWDAAWQIAKSHPLTGTGAGQFEQSAGEIILPKITHPPLPPDPVTLCHAHSNPLQILATMGFLGFLAYIYLWITVFREGFRALRRAPPAQSLFVIGVLSALIGFHIEGFFEYNFGDSEIITLVWFLTGGMMAMSKWETRREIIQG